MDGILVGRSEFYIVVPSFSAVYVLGQNETRTKSLKNRQRSQNTNYFQNVIKQRRACWTVKWKLFVLNCIRFCLVVLRTTDSFVSKTARKLRVQPICIKRFLCEKKPVTFSVYLN